MKNQTSDVNASDNENTTRFPRSPKRMFSLDLSIHADTEQDLRAVLLDILHGISEGQRECFAMGAPSHGGRWKITIDSEMTHEKYMELNDAYLAEVREFEGKFRS